MSRPVLSSATRRLQQSTRHCQRPFSTTRFFYALSEPFISRHSSIYNTNANGNSLHSSRNHSDRYTLRRVNISSIGFPRSRAFSSSTVRPSAKVVQNARNDEEGKPLLVGISERAAEVGYLFFSLRGTCLYALEANGWVWLCRVWMNCGK